MRNYERTGICEMCDMQEITETTEPTKLVDYESFVIAEFKKDFELCREMIIDSIEDYIESGEEKDMTYILLNLKRTIKARGYADFKSADLNETQIDNAIESKENYDRDIINKMLESLKIKERI